MVANYATCILWEFEVQVQGHWKFLLKVDAWLASGLAVLPPKRGRPFPIQQGSGLAQIPVCRSREEKTLSLPIIQHQFPGHPILGLVTIMTELTQIYRHQLWFLKEVFVWKSNSFNDDTWSLWSITRNTECL